MTFYFLLLQFIITTFYYYNIYYNNLYYNKETAGECSGNSVCLLGKSRFRVTLLHSSLIIHFVINH